MSVEDAREGAGPVAAKDGLYHDLDHRTVSPPYLWCAGTRGGTHLWQLRTHQPNHESMSTGIAHTVEHSLLDFGLAHDPGLVLAAPMGCRTGFYVLHTSDEFEVVSATVEHALTQLTDAEAPPHADIIHCGQAVDHDLPGAQVLAARLLRQREQWRSPGSDARLIEGEGSSCE